MYTHTYVNTYIHVYPIYILCLPNLKTIFTIWMSKNLKDNSQLLFPTPHRWAMPPESKQIENGEWQSNMKRVKTNELRQNWGQWPIWLVTSEWQKVHTAQYTYILYIYIYMKFTVMFGLVWHNICLYARSVVCSNYCVRAERHNLEMAKKCQGPKEESIAEAERARKKETQ